MFLGDVGSYFLGAALAITALAAIGAGVPPEAAAFPFLLYAADTGVTLVRRVAQGERWWDAHHEHAYQRLVDAGWSHTATTLVFGALCSAIALLGLASLSSSLAARAVAALAALGVTVAYLALPELVAARRRVPKAVRA
jgi:UDP-N-acetylmuramyl pentapeptide phosphotransferase/UDP-N-acetylglucosamine-1-phosphate transferase